MTARFLPSLGIATVSGLAVFSAGAIAAWLWFAPSAPPSLSAPTAAVEVPINHQEYSDVRSVGVSFETVRPDPLEASVAGRITATMCSAGSEISSGAPLLSIDGQLLLALSTSTPLWRDLRAGDTGDDVTSLQRELARLGHPIAADGRVGSGTLAAVAKLFANAGDAGFTAGTVPFSRIVWLPASSVTIESCEARLGSSLTENGIVATLSDAVTTVAVTPWPTDLVPGERTLTLDSVTVPIGNDGVVSEPEAIRQLTATPSAIESAAADRSSGPERPGVVEASAGTLTGELALRAPIAIGIVPPSAVYSVTDSQGCISSSGTGYPVTIVGSQLGQTSIVIDSGPLLKTVDVSKKAQPPCR